MTAPTAPGFTENDQRTLRAAMAAIATLPFYAAPRDSAGTDVYGVIAELARTLEGARIDEATLELERCDATDAACDRWTPEINAAYFLGLAMGLRLAKASELLNGGAR